MHRRLIPGERFLFTSDMRDVWAALLALGECFTHDLTAETGLTANDVGGALHQLRALGFVRMERGSKFSHVPIIDREVLR